MLRSKIMWDRLESFSQSVVNTEGTFNRDLSGLFDLLRVEDNHRNAVRQGWGYPGDLDAWHSSSWVYSPPPLSNRPHPHNHTLWPLSIFLRMMPWKDLRLPPILTLVLAGKTLCRTWRIMFWDLDPLEIVGFPLLIRMLNILRLQQMRHRSCRGLLGLPWAHRLLGMRLWAYPGLKGMLLSASVSLLPPSFSWSYHKIVLFLYFIFCLRLSSVSHLVCCSQESLCFRSALQTCSSSSLLASFMASALMVATWFLVSDGLSQPSSLVQLWQLSMWLTEFSSTLSHWCLQSFKG